MEDKTHLLKELKIDRNELPRRSSSIWMWLIVVLILVVGSAALWYFLFKPVKVTAATAQEQTAGAVDYTVLDASGYITARRKATVSSKITGKITDILIEEGMRVEEDQILARLDDITSRAQLALSESELASSQAALEEVDAQLKQAQLQAKRVKDLVNQDFASAAELDKAVADRDALKGRRDRLVKDIDVAEKNIAIQNQAIDDAIIRAPFGGIVVSKDAQPGEIISPVSAGGEFTRTGICTIVDMDSLEVEVDVNENYINRVKPKQPASAILNAYPDWKIPAHVIAIIPTADKQKATVKVRLALQEKDPRILTDMGIKVSFHEEKTSDSNKPQARSARVPANAVTRKGEFDQVHVIVDGKIEIRNVQVASRQDEWAIISAGLSGGEQIVVSPSEKLKNGTRVSPAN